VTVAAAVVIYFVVAGTAHLPPFAKPSPPPTHPPKTSPPPSTHPPSTSPPPSPTPTSTLTAAQRNLFGMIPASVKADGSCRPVRPAFGANAEFFCTGAPSVPTNYVRYYSFGNFPTLDSAYSRILQVVPVPRTSGYCARVSGTAAFGAFHAPCETKYGVGRGPAQGRVAEFVYKGTPEITSTYFPRNVMVDMNDADGNILLHFWDRTPHWLNVNGG
jgi:hypothetical protein